MSFLVRATVDFLKDESGPAALEQAVQLALIVAVCIHAMQVLGSRATSTFNTTAAAANSSGS